MVEPGRAATVIIGRDSARGFEVFLVRRTPRSAFMPNMHVFPGGRVEASDDSPGLVSEPSVNARIADVVAAARETFEEAGVLFATPAFDTQAAAGARHALADGSRTFADVLGTLGVRINGAALVPFSHWITPSGEPRRFDTRFFLATMPPDQVAAADEHETHDGNWFDPRAALEANGPAMSFPTRKHLERLAVFPRWNDALDFARAKPITAVMPDALGGDDDFGIPAELEGRW